jgi:hypothetical protein
MSSRSTSTSTTTTPQKSEFPKLPKLHQQQAREHHEHHEHRKVIVAGALAFTLLGITAACATVADLDVTYNNNNNPDASADAFDEANRQKVRESSVENPDVQPPINPLSAEIPSCDAMLPSDSGIDPDGGCDIRQGLGCCITQSAQICMEQRAFEEQCLKQRGPNVVFIGCRQSEDDSVCCWTGEGPGRVARFKGECDGGTIACVDSTGCGGGDCATIECSKSAGPKLIIGQCGSVPPACP